MIARLIEQQQAICAVLVEDRKNRYRMPSDSEFSTLEAVASVLGPLSVFTDALSGEKCVTVSAIRPLLSHIVDDLLHVSLDDCTLVKETISDKLQAHYLCQDTSDLIDTRGFLDTRFRADYLADKERALVRLTSEADSLADKLGSTVEKEDEEETPAPKKLKGLRPIFTIAIAKDRTDDQPLSRVRKWRKRNSGI